MIARNAHHDISRTDRIFDGILLRVRYVLDVVVTQNKAVLIQPLELL